MLLKDGQISPHSREHFAETSSTIATSRAAICLDATHGQNSIVPASREENMAWVNLPVELAM